MSPLFICVKAIVWRCVSVNVNGRLVLATVFGLAVSTAAVGAENEQPLWVNAGFYSAHFDTERGLRNANPGLGIELPLAEYWSLTAGQFVNSDSATSNYLGAYYRPIRMGGWQVGVVSGLFDGYPKAFNGGWFPAVLPTASWESGDWGVNVAFVPRIKNRLYGAISFQLKYRVW